MTKRQTEILDQALKAYFKLGDNMMQPSISMCEVKRKYVYIRNTSQLLAKYDYKNKSFVPQTYNHNKMEWDFEK